MSKAIRIVLIICALIVLGITAIAVAALKSGPRAWEVTDWNRHADYVPSDYYDNPDPEAKTSYHEPIIETFTHIRDVVDAGFASSFNMTSGIQGEILQALTATFTASLAPEDLISMVKVYEYGPSTNIYRMGIADYSGGYIFLLSFQIDNVKIFCLGSPSDGLVEARIIAEFNDDITQFNTIAHNYLNLTVEQQAVDDYRQIAMPRNEFGFLPPRPECDYDVSGFIINVDEANREGFVRSQERIYVNYEDWGTKGKYESIEFSLKYTVSG